MSIQDLLITHEKIQAQYP